MKIQHFKDTDTVYILLTDKPVVETRELNENTFLDLDDAGNLVAVTLEHASAQAALDSFAFERLPVDTAAQQAA